MTRPEDLEDQKYYAVWESPPGSIFWVIDRSYPGLYFSSNWDAFVAHWKRDSNRVILVAKGIDPNELGLPKDYGW